MQPAYLHIITVHLPVIGTPILLVWAVSLFKNQDLKKWKWIYLTGFLLALITFVSYFTGPSTATWVKEHLQNYPQDLVENHALWGKIAFIVQVLLGLISISALSNYWQDEPVSKKIPYLMLGLLFVNTIILFYTAHLGGMVRREDLL